MEAELHQLILERKYDHIRIITGKGIHSKNGSVIREFVKEYLFKRNIHFTQAKIQDGGEGAIEVFFAGR